ncbi:MAG: heme ABC exporter ATP-binding protein CcmA [Legionellales bacterium]|nr:heme ABC exporter ATP-binding protein CcmA [Legionellales bacterium]
MLDVINLEFEYPDKPLLTGIYFRLQEGCLLHLRGGNGAGKTTLLKLLSGLLRPLTGEILYRGHAIHHDLMSYQQRICTVGHKTGLNPFLTVREHCRLEAQRSPLVLRFDDLMDAFLLRGFEDVTCGLLSVGLRRRVSLLRLLMSDAPLWLMDEPLVGLDKEAVRLLMHHVNQHLVRGGAIVLTSHQSLPMRSDHYQEYLL